MISCPMKKYEITMLCFIFILSCGVHLLPLTQHFVWGSDSGEYYVLSKHLYNCGHMENTYEGWGFGYPYFPGMFILTDVNAMFFGISIFDALRFTIPLISSLGVVFLFLIAKKVFKHSSIAFMSSIFISVSMPYVFPTSHPMPGAVGDLLMLMIFLMFLKARENKNFYILAFIAMPAIAVVHHLSAFLLFLSMLCAVLLGNAFLQSWRSNLKYDLLLLLWTHTVFLVLWVFMGGAFREMIVKVGFLGLNPYYIVLLLYLVYPIIYLFLKKNMLSRFYRYRAEFIDRKLAVRRYVICVSLILAIFVPLLFIPIPGTSITLSITQLLFFSPMIFIFSFSLIGTKIGDFYSNCVPMLGWIAGITISLLAGIFVVPKVLIPYRHMEYLLAPLSIAAGVGIIYLIKSYSGYKPKILAFAIVILCIFSIVTIYPEKHVMAGFQEGTSEKEFESVYWAQVNTGVYASDHRMSSMLFGFAGVYATWDTTPETFFGTDKNKTLEELAHAKAPHVERTVNYVLITDDMKSGSAMSPLEPALSITPASESKFLESPFIKVYDNGKVQIYKTGL
jgi:hypothetical protein